MDDFSRALSEALLKEMVCRVCREYMVPPILLCNKGHNICSKCRAYVEHCLTCGAKFSEISNVALENFARSQKYPCLNWQRGCRELLSVEHIAEHHDVCVYGRIKCPFKLTRECFWMGYRSDLFEHVNLAHPPFYFTLSSFRSPWYGDRIVNVSSCLGELFVLCHRIVDGRFYCAVQLIGTSSEASKYKCELTLRAANCIEQISSTLFVRGYSEEFETIFNSGKCLCLDEAVVRHYIVQDRLNLIVTISPLE